MSSNNRDTAKSSPIAKSERRRKKGDLNKRVYNMYSDEKKLNTLRRIRNGEVANHLVQELNISSTTLWRWMRHKDALKVRVKKGRLLKAGKTDEANRLEEKWCKIRKRNSERGQVTSNPGRTQIKLRREILDSLCPRTDKKKMPRSVTPPPPFQPAKKVTTPTNKLSLKQAKTYTAKIMTQPTRSTTVDSKPNLKPRAPISPGKIIITDNHMQKSRCNGKSPAKSIPLTEMSSDEDIEAMECPAKTAELVDLDDSVIISSGHLNRCIARESEVPKRPRPASRQRSRNNSTSSTVQKPARPSVQKRPASRTMNKNSPSPTVQRPANSLVKKPPPVRRRPRPASKTRNQNLLSSTTPLVQVPAQKPPPVRRRPVPASRTRNINAQSSTEPLVQEPPTARSVPRQFTIRRRPVAKLPPEMESGIISRASYENVIRPFIENNSSTERKPRIFVRCSSRILPNPRQTAPKDTVGPGENSWAAQGSQQAPMPSTSRAKEMSPRPSTSSQGGFMIKQDPGTPPPSQQQAIMNPYIQEPPMVQSAPRLLPKPTAPPSQPQVMQQQPRLRVRPPQHVAPAPAPPDPEPQQVCLRWNSFHNNMQNMFPTLLHKEKFVDVTLACEGQTVKCHKVVISSCSAYIERLLTENPCKHPIILMPNTMRYWQIRALVDFMYRGEVNVEHEQLSSLLAAAEFLQVKGLAGPPTSPEQTTNIDEPEPEPPLSPRPKRKRVASPSPVPQQRQPAAAPPTPQQQSRTSLPNSPAVSITRLKPNPAPAQATPSTSRDTGSRAQSPGIEITPVVSFEEIKMEPIDISDSNDESMDPNMHCDVDYDMDNGDGDKDYDDEDLDDGDSGDGGRGEDDTGGGDPGPSLRPSDQPGTSKTTSNGSPVRTLPSCHLCPELEQKKAGACCFKCSNAVCWVHSQTVNQCDKCKDKPCGSPWAVPTGRRNCGICEVKSSKNRTRKACVTCHTFICKAHAQAFTLCSRCNLQEFGPDLTTPGFSGNGLDIDDSAASYCAADLGLTTEPSEDPPDSGPANWKRLTKRWRCHYCPRKDDRKTTVRCIRCTNSICPNHRETMYQCGVCENKPIADTLDFPPENDYCHECPAGGSRVSARCITCFKSVCCMHRSEVPHCVKCPALEPQGAEETPKSP